MFSRIKEYIISFLLKCIIKAYRAIYLPIRVFQVRRKKVIKVAFILSDLGKWKTEPLYQAMLLNGRFQPLLLVTPYINRDNSGLTLLCNYLDKNNYKYYILEDNYKISQTIKPSIIIYQEPYSKIIDKTLNYKHNLRSLFCYVNYGFHCEQNRWLLNQPMLNFCWQIYYENGLALKGVSKHMTNKGKNTIVTGLPMTEAFIQPISCMKNPWRKQNKIKKRIIWAPHYTINNDSAFCYSTFLEYSKFMLETAEKYKDYIQIAFKPHPVLLTKLYDLWGKEVTDKYYSQWESGENTQLEVGDYISLFMHSDAMIHDCSSFTIEYHYTKKPVMYLIKDENHAKGLNEFGKLDFKLHYKGKNENDIETFIQNVINGKDELREARIRFYNDYLLPPNGKSPSENIINAILG